LRPVAVSGGAARGPSGRHQEHKLTEEQGMGRVQDKVAIITGAASGVGKEDAILLAKEGAKVVLTDLNEEAGWRTVQRVNSDGYFLGCKYGVLAMKQRKGGGSIVNMSSISAIVGMSAFCAYSASKGAVAALTRNVAIHARRFDLKIRCNSIHPDGIKTPMVANLHATAKPGQMAEVKDIKQQMSRMADAKDIANVVLFLASDESRFINGAELHVDNGWRIWAER
jgi:NAD(P)-dependent dehydrogenase (short-subunit alcohol dehydrogenase family)